MLTNCGVYCITCKVTGKVYVGSSECLRTRWNNHVGMLVRDIHHNQDLQSDWNLHGREQFELTTLAECSPSSLLTEEQYWVDVFIKRGVDVYNKHTSVARSTLDTRAKMSASKLGNDYHLGHKHTEAAKERMSESKLGKALSSDHRSKLAATQKGKPKSPEAIKKMSEARKRMFVEKKLSAAQQASFEKFRTAGDKALAKINQQSP